MKALPGFELRAIGDGQQSELIDPSGQPRARIEGAALESVHELEDGYLIVSSDGDAFEDCMHVTLCDRSFAPREVIHVGGPTRRGASVAERSGPGRVCASHSFQTSAGGWTCSRIRAGAFACLEHRCGTSRHSVPGGCGWCARRSPVVEERTAAVAGIGRARPEPVPLSRDRARHASPGRDDRAQY